LPTRASVRRAAPWAPALPWLTCLALLAAGDGHAYAQSAPARPQSATDTFEDADGVERPFTATYELYFGRARGEPHYLHAAVASATLLGIGLFMYWANPDANSADWELNRFAAKFESSSVRFDDNAFTTNNWLHPLAGSGYYGLTRIEHVGIPMSLVYASTASTLWEYVLEWREKVSINDLILTPLGGAVLGECFLHLNDYLNIGNPAGSGGQRAARYSVGLAGFIHRALHGEPMRDDPLPNDEIGFSTAYVHRMQVAYQLAYVGNDRGGETLLHSVVAHTELVAIPGFLRTGSFHLWFTEGNFSEMRARVGFSKLALAEVDLRFRTALFGYYTQSFARAPRRGHATALSGAMAFDHRQSWLLGHRDEVALLHLLGPAWDGWWAAGDVSFHGLLEASVDFGGVRPAAYGAWEQANPEQSVKSLLERYGYAYVWGPSGRLRTTLAYRAFEAELRLGYGHYDSIEGADRYQERITRSAASSDELIDYETWLGYQPRTLPLQLRAGFEARMHRGSVEGFDVQRWERFAMLDLGLAF